MHDTNELIPKHKSYLLEIRLVGGSELDKPLSIPFKSELDTLPLAQTVLGAIAEAKPPKAKKTRSDAGIPRAPKTEGVTA